MRVWEREDGYSIVGRPTAWRVRQRMKNGQWLSVFFKRHRAKGTKEERGPIVYIWNVAIHIGPNKKAGSKWYHGWSKKDHNRSTGDGSLAALCQALAYIRGFVENYMGLHDELHIHWSDAKRARAYRYLLRYPGFAIDPDMPGFIMARNPHIYEWKGGDENGRNDENT
jgi:hypothetical protein